MLLQEGLCGAIGLVMVQLPDSNTEMLLHRPCNESVSATLLISRHSHESVSSTLRLQYWRNQAKAQLVTDSCFQEHT